MKNKKDFISVTDFTAAQIWEIFMLAKKLKDELKKKGKNASLLKKKTLVSIFEKPSLRTKLSFEVAMTQLGGHAVYLGPYDIGLGTRESVADVAQVASSMGDILMARTYKHATILDLAHYADVPVINGLSDLEHPCQALADLMTIWELKGEMKDLKITYLGDGENNIVHSLCLGAALLGANFTCASPKGYWMSSEIVKRAKEIIHKPKTLIMQVEDPKKAVYGADVVYTDTWVSMGDETEAEIRLKTFTPYQVTVDLMSLAKQDALFMHDLPAYRGREVAAEVIDGNQSVVFHQAENRLHVQKALIVYLLQPKLSFDFI